MTNKKLSKLFLAIIIIIIRLNHVHKKSLDFSKERNYDYIIINSNFKNTPRINNQFLGIGGWIISSAKDGVVFITGHIAFLITYNWVGKILSFINEKSLYQLADLAEPKKLYLV